MNEYILQVSAMSPLGSSDSSVVSDTTTLPGLPSAQDGLKDRPDTLQIEHIPPHHLDVHWTVPEVCLDLVSCICVHVCVCVGVCL